MKERMTEIIKSQINGAEVFFEDIVKDNGVVHHSITIKENGESVCPCIYYTPERVTDENVEDVTKKIIETYSTHKNRIGSKENFMKYMSEDYVRESVFPYILDYDKNKKMIDDLGLVSRKELNFAVLYRVSIPVEGGFASFRISYQHLDMMKLSPKQIDEFAFANAKRDLYVSSLKDILIESLKKDLGCEDFELDPELVEELFGDDNSSMTVYSNKKRYFGAASMFIPNVFKDKCYVLPSSVHEVITIPADVDGDIEYLKQMVSEINVTQVDEQERLSDNIYYYNGKSLEILL